MAFIIIWTDPKLLKFRKEGCADSTTCRCGRDRRVNQRVASRCGAGRRLESEGHKLAWFDGAV